MDKNSIIERCLNARRGRRHLTVLALLAIGCFAVTSQAFATDIKPLPDNGWSNAEYPVRSAVNSNVKAVEAGTSPDDGTRLIILGTESGPVINQRHKGTSAALVVNGTPYLIDAGLGVVYQLRRAGIRLPAIHEVFITHHHMDHTAGLEPFLTLRWYWANYHVAGIDPKSAPPVNIYGPPSTETLVQASVDYATVSARIFNNGRTGNMSFEMPDEMYEGHDLVVGRDRPVVVYEDQNVTVKAVENTHFNFKPGAPAYKQNDRSYSYKFVTPQGSVVFTGDTGPSPAVTQLAKSADVLVSEVFNRKPFIEGIEQGTIPLLAHAPTIAKQRLIWHMKHHHLSPADVGKMAAKANVRKVVLYHYGPPPLHDYTNAARFVAGVKKYYSGPVVLSRDLMEFDLF